MSTPMHPARLGMGQTQLDVLRTLQERGPYPTANWYWNSHSGTRRLMESLLKRGLVTREGDAKTGTYTITDAGREVIA